MTLDERAEKARTELFARYDKLNALWLQAEEQLSKYHIPKSVEFTCRTYPMSYSEPNGMQVSDCLSLQKLKGKWRICHGSYVSSEEHEVETWTPITECSAEDRIAAARYLPEFRQAVVESAEKFIPKVDAAIQQLADALDQPTNLKELLVERAKPNGRAK